MTEALLGVTEAQTRVTEAQTRVTEAQTRVTEAQTRVTKALIGETVTLPVRSSVMTTGVERDDDGVRPSAGARWSDAGDMTCCVESSVVAVTEMWDTSDLNQVAARYRSDR